MARIVAHNFAAYMPAEGDSPVILKRGEEVPEEALATLEEAGALVPEGYSLKEFLDYKLNAYRAPRGDVLAANELARLAEQARAGGITDITEPDAGAPLAERIRAGLNAEDTVALAEGDPEKARAVLEAEQEASGGEPRKSVQEPLERIING